MPGPGTAGRIGPGSQVDGAWRPTDEGLEPGWLMPGSGPVCQEACGTAPSGTWWYGPGRGRRAWAADDADWTALGPAFKLDYLSSVVAIDFRGGQDVTGQPGRKRPIHAPGEILLMDQDGNLEVRNELDNKPERAAPKLAQGIVDAAAAAVHAKQPRQCPQRPDDPSRPRRGEGRRPQAARIASLPPIKSLATASSRGVTPPAGRPYPQAPRHRLWMPGGRIPPAPVLNYS